MDDRATKTCCVCFVPDGEHLTTCPLSKDLRLFCLEDSETFYYCAINAVHAVCLHLEVHGGKPSDYEYTQHPPDVVEYSLESAGKHVFTNDDDTKTTLLAVFGESAEPRFLGGTVW